MIINELKTFKTFFKHFSSSQPRSRQINQKNNILGWLLKWRDVYKEIIFDILTLFLSV